jgi:hypothetical protein
LSAAASLRDAPARGRTLLKRGDLDRDSADVDDQIAKLTQGLGNTLGTTASVIITLPGRILDVTFGN